MKFHSTFLIIISFIVFSCNGQNTKNSKTIDAKAFSEKIATTPNPQILDVRTPEEFSSDHIDKAVNVNWLGDNFVAEAEKLEDQQNANMLRQMEMTMEDLDGEQTLGFDDFSFDNYRQLLQNMLNQKKKEFENMPNGVFSGIKIENNLFFKKRACFYNMTIKELYLSIYSV